METCHGGVEPSSIPALGLDILTPSWSEDVDHHNSGHIFVASTVAMCARALCGNNGYARCLDSRSRMMQADVPCYARLFENVPTLEATAIVARHKAFPAFVHAAVRLALCRHA
ncbi:hypothetical protein F441_03633 [Phytophthora nicotianae CJ01A1]|uniref:Uncharacterized protein n=2 Tax=Phytophthora nicotianae TaxID=4792 RepID=W2JJV0_PHYNI|nr:hypothetical protein L915_03533 [Phytophthora nicotianae]ETL46659.1 hypothetical protein L916_03481 [Phytophthora nicotianae]ETP23192.1 hypothetical protein F441_03633 [Phytophthora nicotianae CJ01A1]